MSFVGIKEEPAAYDVPVPLAKVFQPVNLNPLRESVPAVARVTVLEATV